MKFSDGLKLGMGLSLGYAIMNGIGACVLTFFGIKKERF